MRASDIAKLAASIAAGSLTYHAAIDMLDDDGDVSLLDGMMASGAGIVGGGVVGSIVGHVMDETGVSDLVDDISDTLFDW